jgi:cytochrome c-type biogenesis protein CcmH
VEFSLPEPTLPEPALPEGMTPETMVAQLGARLASEGGPASDWARLITSLGVLGRVDEARAIWGEAQGTFAADPEGLAAINAAAAGAGLTP